MAKPNATPAGTAIYFASDLHLGVPDALGSLHRERRFISWLYEVAADAAEIHIVGDLFDFWFEYQTVVPKGYFRLLTALADMRERGIRVVVYAGNHDLWYRDYFPRFLDIPIVFAPVEHEWFGRRYFVAHGDGLGPGDTGYKLMKRVFTNRLAQWCFRWLHPDWGVGLANFFSRRSRLAHAHHDAVDYGDREMLYQFALADSQSRPGHIQHYIFGHRHKAKQQPLSKNGPELIVLGDWISHYSYLRIDSAGPKLLFYEVKDLPTSV
jgi:UDP-2,3-diacylglucosamine hydrolase